MANMQPDPNDLAAMGIPTADWPFYQVANPTGPSAPVPSYDVRAIDDLIGTLLGLGIPLAEAIPMAVQLYMGDTGTSSPVVDQPVSPAQLATDLKLSPTEAGGRESAAPTGGPPESGPYSGDITSLATRGGLTALGVALGGAVTPATLAGFAVPAASVIARMAGVPQEANPMYGVPSAQDVQDAYDYGGVYAGQTAKAARDQAVADLAEYGGLEAALNAEAGSPGGWAGAGHAPGVGAAGYSATNPSLSAEGVDTGPGGASMGSESATGGPGGIGGGGPAGGPDYARGGVSRAVGGPRRVTFGEAGPEEAIFIPDIMYRPGLQPNEEAVRRALAISLLRMMLSENDIRTHAWRG